MLYKIRGFDGGECGECRLLSMRRLVALIRTEVSEKLIVSTITAERISELGTWLVVTSS
jgi:hypothetical protein